MIKLRTVAITVALSATFVQASEVRNAITIRPATLNDLDAISAISHQQYQNTFKPLWQKHYAWLTPQHQTIDEFVNEKKKSTMIPMLILLRDKQTTKIVVYS